MGIEARLTNARISFASGLWNPSSAVADGIKKFNCDYIVSRDTLVERKDKEGKWVKSSLKEIQDLITLDAFRGDKKKAEAWFDGLERRQKSVREGDRMTDKNGDVREGYEGNLYVHATSKTRMPVFRGDRTEVDTEADSPVYSGCYVVARVQFYANLKSGQQGLFAGMQGTQFYKSGDAIGGSGSKASADDFEPATDGAAAGDFA